MPGSGQGQLNPVYLHNMKTNQKDDLADLVKWTRGIEFHDEDDDGIGEIEMFFKIRDESRRMTRIFNSLTRKDVIAIVSDFVIDHCAPCCEFDDDWNETGLWSHCGFGIWWRWDAIHDGIRMGARFRT